MLSVAWCSDVVNFNPACRWCVDGGGRRIIKKNTGYNSGQNMLERILWIKYIINIDMHLVSYLYVMDLSNAQKMEHSKILSHVKTIKNKLKIYDPSVFMVKIYTVFLTFDTMLAGRWIQKFVTYYLNSIPKTLSVHWHHTTAQHYWCCV
jgi:hypothetical protein